MRMMQEVMMQEVYLGGGGWRGRRVGRMDSVDRGGRRIGLGRCKKDGYGAWWTDRPPLMQIFFMGWGGLGWGGGGECGKEWKGWGS